ncbi:hypothetical protein [Rugamonas aquatica]|uniref:Uncharacterized protein n=1 Tax=Rugamonas aquatica TaxID=2743357 RepID=A0A6A7N0K8_9BURK|nr:hypothetical protein [Rugamonas aquatica]MQA38516.1 hypothetical protein [Rugamonas aquatica]
MNNNQKKLRLIYVEDEDEFRLNLITTLEKKFDLASIDVGEFSQEQNGGEIGEQFLSWLKKTLGDNQTIDGVILDSDLSGFSNGISKEMLLSAFRIIGLPVCRYSKRQKQTSSERLKHFATLASEGASSILVPSFLLNGPTENTQARSEQLTDWLFATFSGFSYLREAYSGLIETDIAQHNAAELLAKLLKRPKLELDFVGYTGASLFFFGDAMAAPEGSSSLVEERARHVSTRLGYWLMNYIIAFPGPILNLPSAAALVGVRSDTIAVDSFKKAFPNTDYSGPFSGCLPLFFREDIEDVMSNMGMFGMDVLKSAKISDMLPLYDGEPSKSGAYCVATDASIKREDSVGPFDWIPPGASELCRIEKKTYARFGPWLNV